MPPGTAAPSSVAALDVAADRRLIREQQRGRRLVHHAHVARAARAARTRAPTDRRLHRPEVARADAVERERHVLGRGRAIGKGLEPGVGLVAGHRRVPRHGRGRHAGRPVDAFHHALIQIDLRFTSAPGAGCSGGVWIVTRSSRKAGRLARQPQQARRQQRREHDEHERERHLQRDESASGNLTLRGGARLEQRAGIGAARLPRGQDAEEQRREHGESRGDQEHGPVRADVERLEPHRDRGRTVRATGCRTTPPRRRGRRRRAR